MYKGTYFLSYIRLLGIGLLAAFVFCGCVTLEAKLPEPPKTPKPFKLYTIPKEKIKNIVMPDEIAKKIIGQYEDPSWTDKPWVYKLQRHNSYRTPLKIPTKLQHMKILAPNYGYRYKWYQPKRFYKKPECCLQESVFIRDANFFYPIKEQEKCAESPPEYNGISDKVNCDKYKYCVFVVGAENEYQKNYKNTYSGSKILCGRNGKERDKIIEALVTLGVGY